MVIVKTVGIKTPDHIASLIGFVGFQLVGYEASHFTARPGAKGKRIHCMLTTIILEIEIGTGPSMIPFGNVDVLNPIEPAVDPEHGVYTGPTLTELGSPGSASLGNIGVIEFV
jgi:hypothetical protein